MAQISLFKVGISLMLFFVMASNVFEYVAVGTNNWTEDTNAKLWFDCLTNSGSTQSRYKCFRDNPPALIATGLALNILAFLLAIVSQIAVFLPILKDTIALYFVIGTLLNSLLALLFNSVGWFFIFVPTYQQLTSGTDFLSFRFGYSFWLMTPCFACSIIASLIAAAIMGCTCVTNKSKVVSLVKETTTQELRL